MLFDFAVADQGSCSVDWTGRSSRSNRLRSASRLKSNVPPGGTRRSPVRQARRRPPAPPPAGLVVVVAGVGGGAGVRVPEPPAIAQGRQGQSDEPLSSCADRNAPSVRLCFTLVTHLDPAWRSAGSPCPRFATTGGARRPQKVFACSRHLLRKQHAGNGRACSVGGATAPRGPPVAGCMDRCLISAGDRVSVNFCLPQGGLFATITPSHTDRPHRAAATI